jgi:hypothetical protein
MMYAEFLLPNELKGKKINSSKIIPTVCNLKNMLKKLNAVNGNKSALKAWELRSYKHYAMDELMPHIIQASTKEAIEMIRGHLLSHSFYELGASPFDIYIVAYIAQTIGSGQQAFIDYCIDQGMAGTYHSANAIYQVGRGDGVFLGILNEDCSVKDWEFMSAWVGV